MNRNHTGQTTLILILAVVIVLVVAISIKSPMNRMQNQTPSLGRGSLPAQEYLNEVSSFVEACIQEATVDTMESLGRKGSFSSIERIYDGQDDVALFYNQGRVQLPTLNEIVNDIETGLADRITVCLDAVYDTPYDFTFQPARSTATILENSIEMSIEIPTTVSFKGDTVRKNSYRHTIPLGISAIHSTASDIIATIAEHDPFIDMTSLLDHQQPIHIRFVDDTTMVIGIENPEQSIGGSPFTYQFGVKYS